MGASSGMVVPHRSRISRPLWLSQPVVRGVRSDLEYFLTWPTGQFNYVAEEINDHIYCFVGFFGTIVQRVHLFEQFRITYCKLRELCYKTIILLRELRILRSNVYGKYYLFNEIQILFRISVLRMYLRTLAPAAIKLIANGILARLLGSFVRSSRTSWCE